jgi:hypothetical protein
MVVVISGAFINFLLHNHFITEKNLKKKSGEAKDSALVTIFHIQICYQLLQTRPTGEKRYQLLQTTHPR